MPTRRALGQPTCLRTFTAPRTSQGRTTG
jgi:hypothetical protein